MIDRLFNKYTFIFITLLVMHILTITLNGIFAYFDFIVVIFVLTMGIANERNFIWLGLMFGLFTDYARDGFYGPGIFLFICFYLIRFSTDVIMDMTKVHYKILLFSGVSILYCFYNLMITSYTFDSALYISLVRTIVNVAVIFIFLFFFKGVTHVTQNT
ncbi:MAG: hypothetical protein C0603_01520 [Denitrovibrio sp.]|nr:MAG: hypothetical protein C0603_01520 [Denitrovibrio sp.]